MDQEQSRHEPTLPPAPGLARGGVRFVAAELWPHVGDELSELGLVVARVEALETPTRGRLGAATDTATEQALAARGAPATALPVGVDRKTWLADRLARAKAAGARGLAILVGPLAATRDIAGVLHPSDSAMLRFLARASREHPVLLVLHGADEATLAHAEPMPLGRVMREAAGGPSPAVALGAAAATAAALPGRAASPAASPSQALALSEGDAPWRSWILELAAVRGPMPLPAIERAFTEAYVPLDAAIAAGLDEPRARVARDDFRNTFVKSYTESFPTLAVTTKRPRMVLDAFDVASQLGRLHGARSIRLLLVDSMRWDLARQIRARVAAALQSHAVPADDVLLWSALPTTTTRQLETMARGLEALRAPGELEPEAEPLRGRTAEYIRRLRVGPREVQKLDVIESRLHAARDRALATLPEIVGECADIVARHAAALSPRTLLFAFGDHGFTVDRSGFARHGGATPEEVLVGAFAMLVGELH